MPVGSKWQIAFYTANPICLRFPETSRFGKRATPVPNNQPFVSARAERFWKEPLENPTPFECAENPYWTGAAKPQILRVRFWEIGLCWDDTVSALRDGAKLVHCRSPFLTNKTRR
jgi:hypothetical protein